MRSRFVALLFSFMCLIGGAAQAGDPPPGAWSEFRFEITQQDREVIQAAITGMTGWQFGPPIAIASRVYAGTVFYVLVISGKMPARNAPPRLFKIYFYLSPQGRPIEEKITQITPLSEQAF